MQADGRQAAQSAFSISKAARGMGPFAVRLQWQQHRPELASQASTPSFNRAILSAMDATELYERFAPAVRSFAGDPAAPDLLIARSGNLSAYYAPFEWINPQARLVIVGITPGRAQAINALHEARRQLLMGADSDVVQMTAKQTGAFSGPLRSNLVSMLDHIGLNEWLGVSSAADLFGHRFELLQSSSVLQFPVFVDGLKDGNYKGSPDIVATPFLRNMLLRYFGAMVNSLPDVVLVPLGDVPDKSISWLTSSGQIQPKAVLAGLPHPSGANGERISYFLERKPKDDLSVKTNPEKIDAARAKLIRSVEELKSV